MIFLTAQSVCCQSILEHVRSYFGIVSLGIIGILLHFLRSLGFAVFVLEKNRRVLSAVIGLLWTQMKSVLVEQRLASVSIFRE